MDVYETEEQQVEAIKTWWKDNYKMIVGAGVLVVGGILGSQYYIENQRLMKEDASNNYQEIINAANEKQNEVISGRSEILTNTHKDSPYTVLSALIEAKMLADSEKFDEAIKKLSWVEFASTDNAIKEVAFIRRMKIMMAQGENEKSLSQIDLRLNEFAVKKKDPTKINNFSALLLEMKGDILVALAKQEQAIDAYDKAMGEALIAGGNTEILRIKRNNLGMIEPKKP